MSITRDTMVVNLQIGVWQGYRLDKEATRRVTEEAKAKPDAARVNKHLVTKESLAPIITASSAIRTHFYDNTLPWKDNGDRLLPRKVYMPFIERHEKLHGEFKDAVEYFLDVAYPMERQRAEFRMGDLWKADDYPAPRELRRRFYVGLDIDAVTAGVDFRVSLEPEQVDEIRAAMENQMQKRLTRAVADVWGRLASTLGHFAEKMEGDNIFRDTTVTNLQELVNTLPALNIMNDPDLEKIRDEIEKNICRWDPKELRKKPEVRQAVGAQAKEIMDSMAAYMSAFGVAYPQQNKAA